MAAEVDFHLPFNALSYFTRGIIWGQRHFFSCLPDAWTDYKPIPVDFSREAANDYIRKLLTDSNPCLIARFGCGEFEASCRGYDRARGGACLTRWLRILVGKSGPFWWDNSIRLGLIRQAGVFPTDDLIFERFAKRSFEDARQLDLLGTWNAREKMARRLFFPNAKACPLPDLEPFFYKDPWTRVLKGLRVLVVHPFVDTIRSQYEKRRELFAIPDMVPDMELKTYRSVTSFLGLKTPYRDWFEALDKMCDDLSRVEFDVAIVGCGAYGLSLGAFIKRELRKKAVHLGGATQLLFGIKGGRWDADPRFRSLYNDSWCRPSSFERPENFKQHEDGAYW